MCKNNSKNCNYSFFRFPKDADRARNWAMLCQREDLINKKTNLNLNRLCSVHFENTMFSNETRNRLCKNAVPSLFPSIEDSPNQHSNVDQVINCKKRWKNIKDTHDRRNKRNTKIIRTSSDAPLYKKGKKKWLLQEKLSFLRTPNYSRRDFCNVDENVGHDNIEIDGQSTSKDSEMEQELTAKESPPREPTSMENMNYRENLTSDIEEISKERDEIINENMNYRDNFTSAIEKRSREGDAMINENINYSENLISTIEKRSKERDAMIQQLFQTDTETDETDLFFRSIAMTVKKFPRHLQQRAKIQTLTMISNIESEMWSSGPSTSVSAIAQEVHYPSLCSNTTYTDTVTLNHFPEVKFSDVLEPSTQPNF
ncbi:52 kDa repressor of the inhibitor of the protein kinase-like isoform X2 [Diabrotica virgifera virgifera]|uniref:52 kDa repressor of the inhibitor of the protein kinase-like n=1 Tax=Diabrotica virgifera virgifera TaxID=50390 RepID=A0ABM5JIT5_DIAVI|nr:52 kDa repressor of the inhibitor of the protein kinase-like isoform X2 [Diabrotica virgifera virgifera]